MHYKVKEVSNIAGVSVRTLHHYDQIDLLKPSSVSPAGYRLYTDSDLETLQQILFFKELGFDLSEIKTFILNPGFDKTEALKAHKELLIKKKKRLELIIKSVERTIQSIGGGIEMDKKEMFEAFDMTEIQNHQKKYAEEVRQKYPKEVVEECENKTSGYSSNDWAAIQSKSNEMYKQMIDYMDNGPSDPKVQEAISEFRQYTTDNFYTCTPEILRGLGDLYVSDERFTAFFEKLKPGLAGFVRKAINIYCDNLK